MFRWLANKSGLRWLDRAARALESYTSLLEQYPLVKTGLKLVGAGLMMSWTYVHESWLPLAMVVGLATFVLLGQGRSIATQLPERSGSTPFPEQSASSAESKSLQESPSLQLLKQTIPPSAHIKKQEEVAAGQLRGSNRSCPPTLIEVMARWHFLEYHREELRRIQNTLRDLEPKVATLLNTNPHAGYSESQEGRDLLDRWNSDLKHMDAIFRHCLNIPDPNISRSAYTPSEHPVPPHLDLSVKDAITYRRYYEQLQALKSDGVHLMSRLTAQAKVARSMIFVVGERVAIKDMNVG